MVGESELAQLMEGNQRFRNQSPVLYRYAEEELADLASVQTPIAAVVACSDSRVVPEVIFNQPLGSLFVSRVPGNVASDGSKWLIEIAVEEFEVPLVIVMAHTGCLAVGQVVHGATSGTGGPLRLKVLNAVYRAKDEGGDLYRASLEMNAKMAAEELTQEVPSLRKAVEARKILVVPMIYEMNTGKVIRLQ